MSHVDISHVVYLPTYPTALPTYIVASHVLAYFRQSDWSERQGSGVKDCQSLGFCAAGNYMNVHEPIADESGKCMRHVGSIRSGKQQ